MSTPIGPGHTDTGYQVAFLSRYSGGWSGGRRTWAWSWDAVTEPRHGPAEQGHGRAHTKAEAVAGAEAWMREHPLPACLCMTEDPGDGLGERVVTHSLTCREHPEHDG